MAAKKKWPRANKILPIPIYGGTVYLFNDIEKYSQALSYLNQEPYQDINEYAGLAQHFINEKGQSSYLIGCFDDSANTKCHECAHIALKICKHVGVDPKLEEEPFCYLIGWIYNELFGD